MGDGTFHGGLVTTPVMVSGTDTLGFAAIYQSNDLSCAQALDPERLIRCWGAGTEGQIGNGFALDHLVPATVVRTS